MPVAAACGLRAMARWRAGAGGVRGRGTSRGRAASRGRPGVDALGGAREVICALVRDRRRGRAADAVAADRVRARHRPLFHRRARAGAGGLRSRSRPPARSRRSLARARPVAFPLLLGARGGRGRLCHRDAQERAHRASDPAAHRLERQHRGLRRGARGARAHRPHRGARAHDRGPAQGCARARAALGEASAWRRRSAPSSR